MIAGKVGLCAAVNDGEGWVCCPVAPLPIKPVVIRVMIEPVAPEFEVSPVSFGLSTALFSGSAARPKKRTSTKDTRKPLLLKRQYSEMKV